jgi:hypothetical protein
MVSRPEQATRIQAMLSEFESSIKKGHTPEDALVNGLQAARQHTADFSRMGNFGPIMRSVQPYLTASIAGSRNVFRTLRKDIRQLNSLRNQYESQRSQGQTPRQSLSLALGEIKGNAPGLKGAARVIQALAGTTAKIGTTLILPGVLTTLWNLSSEERKKAYDDITPYERENNFIIMPPTPVMDERGRYNAIKIPLAPGFSNILRPFRRKMEEWAGLDPVGFKEMAQAAIGTLAPIDPTIQGATNNLMAQPVKPLVEIAWNKNLFTGRQVVPEDLLRLDPEYQYDKKTSGTSIFLGEKMGVSPMVIDHLVKGYFSRGGTQIQNAFDHAIAGIAGAENWQVGGQSVPETAERRFLSAQGGANLNRFYEANKDSTSALNTYNKLLNESRDQEAETFYNANQLRIDAGIETEAKRKLLQDITQEMRAAEEEGDVERLKELRQQKSDIAKEAVDAYREQLNAK